MVPTVGIIFRNEQLQSEHTFTSKKTLLDVLYHVSWYKYLIVSLVFSHFGFWSGNLFLIAPFPDLCLLVLFSESLIHLR